jgi:hypothetical protein
MTCSSATRPLICPRSGVGKGEQWASLPPTWPPGGSACEHALAWCDTLRLGTPRSLEALLPDPCALLGRSLLLQSLEGDRDHDGRVLPLLRAWPSLANGTRSATSVKRTGRGYSYVSRPQRMLLDGASVSVTSTASEPP